jgi:hypothetical protein
MYGKPFASTLTQEQLPFIISKLANYGVRRMVEQFGVKATLEQIAADEKQQKVLERIINEEFNHLPVMNEFKAGVWVQFTEPKHYRHVTGIIKSVTKEGIKVTEYNDTGARQGWAPTGQEWVVVPNLISNIVAVEAKLTVTERIAAEKKEAAEKAAEKATAADAAPAPALPVAVHEAA